MLAGAKGQAAPPGSRALATASGWTIAASGTSFAFAVVQGKAAAVVLGAAGLGVLGNIAAFLPLVATLAAAPVGQGLVREIAAARARGDGETVARLVRFAALVPLALGALAGLLAATLAPQVSELLLGDSAHALLVAVAALALPPLLLVASYQAVLQGFGAVVLIAKTRVAANAAGTLVVLLLLAAFGLTGAVVGLVATAALQLAVLVATAPWALRLVRGADATLPREVGTVLGFGFASIVALLASNAATVLVRADIAHGLGLEQAGLYQPIAVVSDTYLELLIASTSVYLFPRLSELLTLGDRGEAAREMRAGLRLLLVVTTPLLILVTASSELLLIVFYAPAFVAAAPSFDLQMAGTVPKVVAWSVGAALLPGGFVRAWLLIGLVTSAVRYAGAHVLLAPLGLPGVAVGYDLAWAWSAVASTIVVARAARLRLAFEDAVMIGAAVAAVLAVLATKLALPAASLPTGLAVLALWLVYARNPTREFAESLRNAALRA